MVGDAVDGHPRMMLLQCFRGGGRSWDGDMTIVGVWIQTV